MGADIWYINAQLYKLDSPEILYIMDMAQQYACPNLGAVLLWLRDPAETLLKELETGKRGVATMGYGKDFPEPFPATQTDIEWIKTEIELIKEFERRYDETWRKFRKDHGLDVKSELYRNKKASYHCMVFEAHKECKLEGCICQCHKQEKE